MWSITIVFCLLLTPLSLEAFKVGDEGVCKAKVSVPKTRTKLVTINKWCGKKKCVVKKTERYKETIEKPICCTGWEYIPDKDICSPICRTGCIGGRCVAPEICQCDPPAILNQTTCIQPVCDPPCVNGKCINNTCICEDSFVKYNSTHCVKCDENYSLNEHFDCVPICSDPCINGKCVSPDTCACLDGYFPKNGSVCEPICSRCINSVCVAPNKCSCLEGYVYTNDSVCSPTCDCDECIEPYVCKCNEGFKSVNGSCEPICDSKSCDGICVDGICQSNETLEAGLCKETVK